MAKSSKPRAAKPANKRKQAQQASAAPTQAPKKLSRRETLLWGKWTAAGVVVLGAGGTWLSRAVVAAAAEHDLDRIGKGKPVVVQVHDPQCALCTQLQRETRKAMRQFGECDLIYLVADINKPEGRAFARQHNVQHVTLVLLDGQGQSQRIVNGVHSRSQLDPPRPDTSPRYCPRWPARWPDHG